MWLDKDMQWLAKPSGKRGRSQAFSDAAIQFCLSIKCLFGQTLRQTLGMVESLLRLAGVRIHPSPQQHPSITLTGCQA
jgi:hypothetical protein